MVIVNVIEEHKNDVHVLTLVAKALRLMAVGCSVVYFGKMRC